MLLGSITSSVRDNWAHGSKRHITGRVIISRSRSGHIIQISSLWLWVRLLWGQAIKILPQNIQTIRPPPSPPPPARFPTLAPTELTSTFAFGCEPTSVATLVSRASVAAALNDGGCGDRDRPMGAGEARARGPAALVHGAIAHVALDVVRVDDGDVVVRTHNRMTECLAW